MAGTISLNDAVSASGLDPGVAPDWRSVAPSSARLSFATPQFSCTSHERDWFLYLAYSAGERPGTVLRRFGEAFASGAPVPCIPDLGEPKSQRRLIRPADRALFSFMLEIEMSRRAMRGRMLTACRSARSCAVSWSTMCGESELRDPRDRSPGTRPSSQNRKGRREIKPPERKRPARLWQRAGRCVPGKGK
jgi:hypothetical protein